MGLLLALVLEKARLLAYLEAEEERLRALLEHSQDVVYVLDEEARIRFVSPSVRSVLGYDPEGYRRAALNALAFIHPEDQERARALFQELLARPEATLRGSSGSSTKTAPPSPWRPGGGTS